MRNQEERLKSSNIDHQPFLESLIGYPIWWKKARESCEIASSPSIKDSEWLLLFLLPSPTFPFLAVSILFMNFE